jgi:hypothetical protein
MLVTRLTGADRARKRLTGVVEGAILDHRTSNGWAMEADVDPVSLLVTALATGAATGVTESASARVDSSKRSA